MILFFFFFSSRRRHTRSLRDWSSDVCSSDLGGGVGGGQERSGVRQEAVAGLGQLHAAGAADEQRFAEAVLQPLDALGEGLLGEEQPGGGAAEVQLLGGDNERPHLGEVQLHVSELGQQPRVVNPAPNSC